MSRIGKRIETDSKRMVARSCRRKGWRVTASEEGLSFWSDDYVVELNNGDDYTTL